MLNRGFIRENADTRDVTSAEMMKSANFKGLYFNFIIGTMIGLMMIGLTNSIGIELIGMAQKDVVLFISVFAVFNGIGRPVFGWLTDRLSARTAMLLSYAQIITAAGLMLWAKMAVWACLPQPFDILVQCWWLVGYSAYCNQQFVWPKTLQPELWHRIYRIWNRRSAGVSSSGVLLDTFQNYDYIFYLVIASCLMGSLLTLMLLTGNRAYKNEVAAEKHLPDLAGRNSSH